MTIAHRVSATACGVLMLAATAAAQTPENVTVGVESFLDYSADLHEADHFNAFDVTRGYINIEATLSDRVRVRLTPDVRPTTDANLNTNLTLRLAYASIEAKASDTTTLLFGMHETPWLTYEESIDRYRVIGPMFAEDVGLIPGETDLGASVRVTGERTEVHVGVYNGEGYGVQESDKYKNVDGRVTFHPFTDGPAKSVGISAFYQYGWYAKDHPRNVLIVMGSYDAPKLAATAQYLSAKDNPFLTADVERRGLSFFGEVRQGLTGWAGLGRVDYFEPDILNENDWQRRYIFGGAHWSRLSHGRVGVVVTLEQTFQGTTTSELTGRRLLAQTDIEF